MAWAMDGRKLWSGLAHQLVTSMCSIYRSSNTPPNHPSMASRMVFQSYMRWTRFTSVVVDASFFGCPCPVPVGRPLQAISRSTTPKL
ncbi:hypothetical protein HU200_013501 [Digitaria exilis]|uniref:Uncharacterized protein n=1 Tax=Digitaria exilis TaxID=1010633 RepID=A0A835FD50_9POAL|nr:hypothetical protein HU200_013501 [Digitaria exilis]